MEGHEIAAFVKRMPPVTKLTCFATFLLTLTLIADIAPVSYYYHHHLVFKQYELWRLFTSFFVASPNINLLFEVMTLHRSISSLEDGPYLRRSADLAWQMIFACIGIILVTRPINSFVFFSSFLTCLAYMSAATAPYGSTTSFLGLITLPISYLPYCIIVIELFVNKPEGAARAIAGAIVGWFWFFAIYRDRGKIGILASWGQAPGWFRGLFQERKTRINGGVLKKEGRVGEAINVGTNAAGSSCGNASGAHVWGSGARLG